MNEWKMEPWESILSVLPQPLCNAIKALNSGVQKEIREVRLRLGQPVYLQTERVAYFYRGQVFCSAFLIQIVFSQTGNRWRNAFVQFAAMQYILTRTN